MLVKRLGPKEDLGEGVDPGAPVGQATTIPNPTSRRRSTSAAAGIVGNSHRISNIPSPRLRSGKRSFKLVRVSGDEELLGFAAANRALTTEGDITQSDLDFDMITNLEMKGAVLD